MPSETEQFLHPPLRNNKENNREIIGFTRESFVVIGTLLVCALLALFASAFIWYKENNDEIKNFLFSDTTTPDNAENAFKILPSYSSSCNKRIVGYYTEWESSVIDKNQLELMTHAVFATVRMDANGKLSFHNSQADQRFSELKRAAARAVSGVQVMVSLGGYENSQYFSTVVADENKRRAFISSIRSFLEEHQVDGVDIFWRWVNVKDKYYYALFLEELRKQLTTRKKRYIISIVLPPAGVSDWEMGYSLDDIINSVDFVNVFTMDYYGPWPNQWGTPTGPSAPLYHGIGVKKNFNVDWTMNYYTCKIGSGRKLNIVIPFYSRLWGNVGDALSSRTEVFRNVELIDGKAQGMPYMSQWTVNNDGYISAPSSWDEETKTSYIWSPKTKTFLTFETPKSIESKISYVMEMGLGGVWIWFVDQDDENHSLLKSMPSEEFCNGSAKYIKGYKC